MICEVRFHIKKNGELGSKGFCARPELIENYDKAIADTTQVWDCHHRMEEHFSQKELIALGLYYNRPPEELIFLTEEEHTRMNSACKRLSGRTGSKNPFYGKRHTKEQKERWSKITSEKNKGCHWWNNGTTEKFCRECPEGWEKGRLKLSEEIKKKMSESNKGKPSHRKGKHWKVIDGKRIWY